MSHETRLSSERKCPVDYARLSTIHATYNGVCKIVTAPAPLRFGRANDNDLCIPGNPAMHRRQGRLDFAGDQWWLTNVGATTPLHIRDADSASTFLLSSEQSLGLSATRATITFTPPGGEPYELSLIHI